MTTATKTETNCPNCKSQNYGLHSGESVTMGGWYGGQRFAWGQCGGARVVRITGLRCDDCGHVESVDPDFA